MSEKIYAYFEDTDAFRLTTIKKWEREMTISGAKKYLKNHLLKSLKDDFPVAYVAYKKKNVGYFALPRIIFPYITFLGALYKGKDNTLSALNFISDYLGRVSEEYKDRAGIDYIRYRHGLLHSGMPKIFYFGKTYIGYNISYQDVDEHNRGDHLQGNLIMYPKLFYQDLCSAIELYIDDFDNNEKNDELLSNFKKTFIENAKIFKVKDIKGGKEVKSILRKGLRKYNNFYTRPN